MDIDTLLKAWQYLRERGITRRKDWKKLHDLNVAEFGYPSDVKYPHDWDTNIKHFQDAYAQRHVQSAKAFKSIDSMSHATVSKPYLKRILIQPDNKPSNKPKSTNRVKFDMPQKRAFKSIDRKSTITFSKPYLRDWVRVGNTPKPASRVFIS